MQADHSTLIIRKYLKFNEQLNINNINLNMIFSVFQHSVSMLVILSNS